MQKYFLYKIHIHFPIDIKQLIITTQSLKDQNNLFELIFDIASLDDYLKAWEIIEARLSRFISNLPKHK